MRTIFLAALVSCATVARAQDGQALQEPGAQEQASEAPEAKAEEPQKAPVYLKSPGDRLARLAGILDLDPTRKAKIEAILKGVDAGVRGRIASGNRKIRALLTEKEKAAFDGMRDDTEGVSMLPEKHLTPMHLGDSSGGKGSDGSGGSSGGQSGGRRGRGGHRSHGSGSGGGSFP